MEFKSDLKPEGDGERRWYGRRAVDLEVREIRPNPATRRVSDLGAGGMYVSGEVPYGEGTLAVFEICFSPGTPKVVTPARVVRWEKGRGAAFEFLLPHVELTELLKKGL